MNKRKLHHYWTKIRPITAKYFFIAAAGLLIVGVIGLRQNNIEAIRLRDEVLRIDQQDGDVEAALKKLRAYTHAHMNSELGGSNVLQPIQLKYRYERLVKVEKDRVSAANEKIYNDAQTDCERRFPEGLSGSNRVPCIEEYVSSRNIKEQPVPDSLYKFSFSAPRWSPDLAGISLLLSAVSLLLGLSKLWVDSVIKRRLHDHM